MPEECVKLETNEVVAKLELTITEINQILAALQEAPYKSVKGLIDNIIAQAQASMPKREPEPIESSE